MDSPYKPGFGARPAVLVGRDRQLGLGIGPSLVERVIRRWSAPPHGR